MKKEAAISPYDYVSVDSGTDETYIPFNDDGGEYNVATALDNINGEVVSGGLKSKTDYLEETKEQIKQAIAFRGGEVGDVFRDYADVIREIVPTDTLSVKYTLDTDGVLRKLPVVMDFTGVEDVGDFALRYAYGDMGDAITGIISFPDLLKVTGYEACEEAFYGDYIVSVSMPKLEKIDGPFSCYKMFIASKVRGVNLESLKTISGDRAAASMFFSCPIENIELPKLEIIQGRNAADSMFRGTNITWPLILRLKTIDGNSACANMFRECKSLSGTNFDGLTTIAGSSACSYMFADSDSEQFKIFTFPALRTVSSSGAFNNMFKNSVNVNVVFPKNMRAKIESLTGYSLTNPFGATSGFVGFYLPSTYLLRGNGGTYERNPSADYNGENSAWRVLGTSPDSTSFWIYRGMSNDPVVGTAIYSDRECTVQVDTVIEITEEE